ncbi:MAG: acyl-CoA thioesterase [Bacteroidetes bacterium]|nr:acyl-CoA thioesterase [Bacteroidota bacterium]
MALPVSHPTQIRVRYADTDQMQIVYNGKYLEYFEVGRTELIRSLGYPYAQMEADGIRLPLVEAHCRFHQPAQYDDVLTIISEVREEPRATLRIDYRVIRENSSGNDTLIATGYTVHAFLDITTLRPVRPTPRFLEALENGHANNADRTDPSG